MGLPIKYTYFKVSLSRQKEIGEGGIPTTLLALYCALQNQAQAPPLSMPEVSKFLCYASNSSAFPSELLISLTLSAFPSLFFSSRHYYAVVPLLSTNLREFRFYLAHCFSADHFSSEVC